MASSLLEHWRQVLREEGVAALYADPLNPVARELVRHNKGAIAALVAIAAVVGVAFLPGRAWCVEAVEGVRAVATFGLMVQWSYWMHRLGHWKWVDRVPFLRLHVRMHHDDVVGQALPAENFVVELLTNLLVIGGLLLLLVPGVDRVLSKRVVVLYAASYTFIHVVNYHRPLYAGFHRGHHEDVRCNFGPSIMDALAGTYVPDRADARPEDMRSFVPVFAAVACCVLAYETWRR